MELERDSLGDCVLARGEALGAGSLSYMLVLVRF